MATAPMWIFDPIGGDVFDASRRVAAFEGVELALGQAPEALRRLSSRASTGKVVLIP
ncbi:MAG: hypothetical protein ACRDRH_09115 [Pseudonocardia sp.]